MTALGLVGHDTPSSLPRIETEGQLRPVAYRLGHDTPCSLQRIETRQPAPSSLLRGRSQHPIPATEARWAGRAPRTGSNEQALPGTLRSRFGGYAHS